MKPDNHEETAPCEDGDGCQQVRACDHISRMLARISDKWSLLVVRVLGHGPLRFNALRREVGEISQKVLASTLRELEENGFVSRTVTPTTPPQVEYALTPLGRSLSQAVRHLADWAAAHQEKIADNRLEYDARKL